MLILIVKYKNSKNQLIQSTQIIKILQMKLAVVILEAELILSCLARSHKVKDQLMLKVDQAVHPTRPFQLKIESSLRSKCSNNKRSSLFNLHLLRIKTRRKFWIVQVLDQIWTKSLKSYLSMMLINLLTVQISIWIH